MEHKEKQHKPDPKLDAFTCDENSQKLEIKNKQSFSKVTILSFKNKNHCSNSSVFQTADDRTNLLRIFPEELWLIIFDKLKNPEDLANAYQSSPVLREWLLPKRTLFLFPKVWNILGMKFETSLDHAYQEDKGSAECLAKLKELPTETNWFSGILKMRQVCRTWHNSINHFYRNLDGIYGMRNDATKKRNHCRMMCDHHEYGCWTRIYDVSSSNNDSDFENHFCKTHQSTSSINHEKSPFLSNYLYIYLYNDAYSPVLNRTLLKYGAHIWHCTVGVKDTTSWIWCKEKKRTCTTWDMEQLKGSIRTNPMPSWKLLKFLRADWVHPLIVNELLSKNSHVSMLEVLWPGPEPLYDINNHVMTNLSQLYLEIFSQSEYKNLQTATWKLTKVYLSFEKCRYFSWSQIFKLVEKKWGTTAKEVMLQLPKPNGGWEVRQFAEEHKSLRLYLPRIERLRLVFGNVSAIDFILPMKKLIRRLEVFETYKDVPYEEGPLLYTAAGFIEAVMDKKIICFDGLGCGGKVNFWDILENLEAFEYNDNKDYLTTDAEVYD